MIEFYFERLILLVGFVIMFQTGHAEKYDFENNCVDVDSIMVKSDFARYPALMKENCKLLILLGF